MDSLILSIGVVAGFVCALWTVIRTRRRRAIVGETRLDALRKIEQAH